MPIDTMTEAAVCGTLLEVGGQGAHAVKPMVRRLRPSSFGDIRHRTIFEAIESVVNEGLSCDLLTVRTALTKRNQIENAGGDPYLSEIANSALSPLTFDQHAQRLAMLEASRLALEPIDNLRAAILSSNHEKAFAAILETQEQLRVLHDRAAGTSNPNGEWMAHLDKGTTSASGLAQLAVPPREPIMGDWFREGDLGFIYGPRGLGKTWLAIYLARKCAEGKPVGDWNCHKPRRVLYVDGEMPLDSIRERDAALSGTPADGMFYLQHEALFHLTGKVLNLTSPTVQAALLEKCNRDRIEILFLDNLSCLFTGIKENEADAWELVLPWLLDLRRNRIAVVFIAHAGRNGFMRGTSRREDAAFWMMQLTETKDTGEIQNGARFICRFVKNRNATEQECPPLEWCFQKPKDAAIAAVSWKKISTLQVFRQWIEDGLTSASDIAEEMGLSKGQVSKMAKKGIDAGWLKKHGRNYAITSQP